MNDSRASFSGSLHFLHKCHCLLHIGFLIKRNECFSLTCLASPPPLCLVWILANSVSSSTLYWTNQVGGTSSHSKSSQ
jgi:hypothetical protein